jgi:hypothetical protein
MMTRLCSRNGRCEVETGVDDVAFAATKHGRERCVFVCVRVCICVSYV